MNFKHIRDTVCVSKGNSINRKVQAQINQSQAGKGWLLKTVQMSQTGNYDRCFFSFFYHRQHHRWVSTAAVGKPRLLIVSSSCDFLPTWCIQHLPFYLWHLQFDHKHLLFINMAGWLCGDKLNLISHTHTHTPDALRKDVIFLTHCTTSKHYTQTRLDSLNVLPVCTVYSLHQCKLRALKHPITLTMSNTFI